MKQVSKFLMATTMLIGFYACSCDDNGDMANGRAHGELYKKWIVQSPMETSSAKGTVSPEHVESLEFTDEGIFVIVGIDGGRYTITDNGSTLDLGEAGTITINELNDGMFDFTFEVSNNTVNLYAEPGEEMATNASNEALFKYWRVLNIEDYNEGAQGPEQTYTKIEILFTPYRSYIEEEVFEDGSIGTGSYHWQWKNDGQTTLCLGIDDEPDFSDCDRSYSEKTSFEENKLVINSLDGNETFEVILAPVN